MIVCNDCKLEKPDTEFPKRSKKCKECVRRRRRALHAANPELAQQRREKYREWRVAYMRKRYQANREKYAAYRAARAMNLPAHYDEATVERVRLEKERLRGSESNE